MQALGISDYRVFLEQPDWWVFNAAPKFLEIEAKAQKYETKRHELRAKAKAKALKK